MSGRGYVTFYRSSRKIGKKPNKPTLVFEQGTWNRKEKSIVAAVIIEPLEITTVGGHPLPLFWDSE